jgi:hypothetical protein
MHDPDDRGVQLHLIREDSALAGSPARPRRWRRRLWLLAGIGLFLFGSDVLAALCAAKQTPLGIGAVIVIWLQGFDCLVRGYRSR